MLLEDGRRSFTAIGRAIGMTHTGVRKHYETLVKEGLIRVKGLLNVKASGFELLLLSAEIPSYEDLKEFYRIYSKCPRMLILFTTPGEYNVYGVMLAESEDVRESIMTVCTVRKFKGLRRIELRPVLEMNPPFLPIRLPRDLSRRAPCGADCPRCERYKRELCIGCPSTTWYKGPL